MDVSRLSKRSRKKLNKSAIISGNVLLLILVSFFVIENPTASQTVRSSEARSLVGTAVNTKNPLDELSSSTIALNISQSVGLAETTAVRNNKDSDTALLAVVPSDVGILAKPQIVATSQKSKKDITRHKVKSGETASSIADKFNVSANSIKWSNGLFSDFVAAGKVLFIPPAEGVVYKVKSGDTINSILNKYQKVDKSYFLAVNDIESGNLVVGDKLWLPNAVQAPARATYSPSFYLTSFSPSYGFNGYDYGYCTWYVANKVSIPTNWGNANTWAIYARLSGWNVSNRPVVGAIAQNDSYRNGAFALGHVGVVEAVSKDKTQIKFSDMNGLAGWGRVGYSGWVSASSFQHYIYR